MTVKRSVNYISLQRDYASGFSGVFLKINKLRYCMIRLRIRYNSKLDLSKIYMIYAIIDTII